MRLTSENNDYEYDGMNRLASGEGETNTFDEISNLVTKGTATYLYQDPDEPNCDQMRLDKFNNGTEYRYTYDANGNPVQIQNRFTSLSYDNLNALRQIVHGQTDDYWYNAAGLRVKRKEDSLGTWKTTYTLFEGDNILMQEVYDATGRKQVCYNIIVNGQILAQYKRVYIDRLRGVFLLRLPGLEAAYQTVKWNRPFPEPYPLSKLKFEEIK